MHGSHQPVTRDVCLFSVYHGSTAPRMKRPLAQPQSGYGNPRADTAHFQSSPVPGRDNRRRDTRSGRCPPYIPGGSLPSRIAVTTGVPCGWRLTLLTYQGYVSILWLNSVKCPNGLV